MEKRPLLFQRLLDLDHHFHVLPDIGGAFHKLCASSRVLVIGKTGAQTRTLFDQDLVACSHIALYVIRCQADTEFIVLDFPNTSDFQNNIPPVFWDMCIITEKAPVFNKYAFVFAFRRKVSSV